MHVLIYIRADYEEKMEQYEAMLITLRAAKAYTKRFAETAAEYAAKETDPQRKSELEQMSANLEQIAGGPAKTYWQALQLFNLLTTLIEMEANGQSISYGRFDQWLDPYLQHDLKQGMITKEFALELLEVQFVKLNNPTKLKMQILLQNVWPWIWRRIADNWRYWTGWRGCNK